MNIVLLSGGSGKRLWPLSNDVQSKQFLKLLKNNRGEYESMVQRVVRQLTSCHENATIFVSCNHSQSEIIQRQLGSVETILEPSRRDTFPAIALAAAHLKHKKHMDNDDVFVVCPIDVFADNTYFELLSDVVALATTGKQVIGLLGAIPSYPSEKYGYIEHNGGKVTGFKEKPNVVVAEKLIEKGALWNCGVFAVKIGYVLNCASKYVAFDSYEELYAQYSKLPQISFDYEIVENEPAIGVIIYEGTWKDLGTWNTLTEEISGNSLGKYVLLSENSANTHVLNMLDIPIIVQDVEDTVVIASYDGILVSSKQGSSFLKPLAEQIEIQPMYEQRSWGDYRILEYNQKGDNLTIVKRVRIEPGQAVTSECTDEMRKVIIVLGGKAILTNKGQDSIVSTGSLIDIRSDFSLLAATEVQLIEITCYTEGMLEVNRS